MRFLLLLSVFGIPILVFILQAAASTEAVRKALAKFFNVTDARAQFIAFGLLVSVYVVGQVLLIWRPFRRFIRFERSKRKLLTAAADGLIEDYSRFGWELRVNVMLPVLRLCSLREPWKKRRDWHKLSFWRRHLTPSWVSRTMQHEPDRDVVLTDRQGLAGKAYRQKKALCADLTARNVEEFNLGTWQLEQCGDLKFVISFPIRDLDPDTAEPGSKVIGILNIDSRSEGSQVLVTNVELREEIMLKVRAISELCSQLY